jgi:hypothetical protein
MEDEAVLMESGEAFPLSALPSIIAAEPSSMIVCMGAARLLGWLDREFSDRPDWQWRVAPERKDIMSLNGGGIKRQRTSTIVHFFGFRPPEKSKKKGRYHYPIDPLHYSNQTIHELIPGNAPRVVKLIQWGRDVREWCEGAGVKVRPSSGGVAGQLLKHPDFFPVARRKVPQATNARARAQLPGNYYRLMCNEGEAHSAYYLDMSSAHHNIAAELTLPDPDTLRARGRYTVTDDTDVTVPSNAPWVRIGTRAYDHVMDWHGLLYVNLMCPELTADQFPPPYMERAGLRMAWVFTNELPMIRELGGIVNWITAGWVSPDAAPGLNRYAEWSMDQLRESEEVRKRWLKPTLLAGYGILAARPRTMEFGFRQAKNGVPRQYPAGSAMLQAIARVGDREVEMPTANVIYRGMIEAEQRMRSLHMARWLTSLGLRVLAVYADSVFVESNGQLPMLPYPWSIQDQLDRLTFLSSTSFTSAQLTKLPGVSRESAERYRILESVRGNR